MFNELDMAALVAVCDYLNRDKAEHLAASGKWTLDPGKLAAALDAAGITGFENAPAEV